jgi:hypothetical protein
VAAERFQPIAGAGLPMVGSRDALARSTMRVATRNERPRQTARRFHQGGVTPWPGAVLEIPGGAVEATADERCNAFLRPKMQSEKDC